MGWRLSSNNHPIKSLGLEVISLGQSWHTEIAYNAAVQALASDASLTDFAPAIGSNFSAASRTGASAGGNSLISFQHEGCITERWTFGQGSTLDKVVPLVGLGNGGLPYHGFTSYDDQAMITLPPRLKAAARFILRQRVRQVSRIRESIEGKSGIEIGGPSYAFTIGGIVPIYRYISHLDHINFSGDTVWGKHSEIIIREGTDLHGLPDCAFDFVLSSHNLEHIANPVKALLEWKRVMKSGGSLILILPNYRFTFDHRRAPTPICAMTMKGE